MKAPSTTLLGAILHPITRCTAQTRASSTTRKVTALDKLHGKQKQAIREERQASVERARTNPNLHTPPPSTPSATSTSPDSPFQGPPSTSPHPTTPLPYTISRTRPGHQLPIYNLSKGGGTKHLTRLRKVSGNLNALKDDLTKALGLEGGLTNRRGEKVEGVTVNWQTNHIIVRGWRGPEIKAWAESRGF